MHRTKGLRLSKIEEEDSSFFLMKILLAILSGIMMTASFPPGRLSFLAWFALVPLFKSLENASPSTAFRLGFIAGAVHYLTLIYWIVLVLTHYGGLSILASIGPFLLLCLYLALYPAVFSVLITRLKGHRFDLILMACFWVCLEYLRSNLLTGFPWCLLGYTQYNHLHLIQIADLCGVYGLSFLIVLVNSALYRLTKNCPGGKRSILKWDIIFTLLMVSGALAYGHYRLTETIPGDRHCPRLRVTIVQANIDQSIKWDTAYRAKTMETYQRLTRSTCDFKPELIVWPETAVPFFFQNEPEFSQRLFSIAKEMQATLIFGSPAYIQNNGDISYYNRAYLMGPHDQTTQRYDKTHLVPFGEYIPLKKLLFFINRLVPAAGDFKEGDTVAPLKYEGLSPGILICFEAIFPELARAQTKNGADLLVNLTNDAWFGTTSAPYQHLSMTVLRAVENRRTIIRAANTGFSAFIEPQGRIIATSSLFREETLTSSVRLSHSPLTFYTRFGDLFALFLTAISFIFIVSCLWAKRIR